ncbi:hypothetical protein ABT297_33020 [Dactylosporangium sp. NPDC000555]|uniref:hypothetical protein n=1 Tax=Dactylosporangium sp. NPDC000555 TaxID=3154260 RepID=UPI00332BA827
MGAAAAVWRFLVGPPLRARQAAKEQITPIEGLPALSPDAHIGPCPGETVLSQVIALAVGRNWAYYVMP